MHFKSIVTFLAKSANEKKIRQAVNERWHLRNANSVSITSPDHRTGHPWRRPGAGMQRLASAGPQVQHERGGAYWQTNWGFTNLAIVTKFSPLPEQNDDLRFCLPCEKCEWWGRRERAPVNFLKESFADKETCRDRYRIQCIQLSFSQTLFDFKRLVFHSISPKFSGEIPYVLSKPRICFLGSKDKRVLF